MTGQQIFLAAVTGFLLLAVIGRIVGDRMKKKNKKEEEEQQQQQ